MAGAVVMLGGLGTSPAFVAPGALAGALLLVVAPVDVAGRPERSERIRLAGARRGGGQDPRLGAADAGLIQRHAADSQRVASLARRQERELRRWLYGAATAAPRRSSTRSPRRPPTSRTRTACASRSRAPATRPARRAALAARARRARGADERGEVLRQRRDRGLRRGRATEGRRLRPRPRRRLRPRAVGADRRGLAESIEARMLRAGGRATITLRPARAPRSS